jgi:hypothetical protein
MARRSRGALALTATVFILDLTALGTVRYLYEERGSVAVESLRAMTLRTAVWLALLLGFAWMSRTRQGEAGEDGMKRIGLSLLAVAMVAGFTGCGFDPYESSECSSFYCDALCNKAVVCGTLPASEVATCIPSCEVKVLSRSDVKCQETFSPALGLSCDDLSTFLGLRSALEIPGKSGSFHR